jgi:hypothetical protein
MRTIQTSIGELIEAIYGDLVESYGDKELAVTAAHAIGNDLLAEVAPKRPPRTPRARRP